MAGYESVVLESFNSLEELCGKLSKRENNKEMKHKKSSQEREKSEGWYGTKNYEEAVKLLQEGHKEITRNLKCNVKNQSRITSKYTAEIEHPKPNTGTVGYMPSVPNAILGLTNSMINVERKPMKRKTLSLIYCIGGNCDKDIEYFEKAGAAMLSAVDVIEKAGIQTEIKLCFFPVEDRESKELTFPTVTIKHYGERYSINKISFPIAHTSMFRRIGFKWIETSPDIKGKYSTGYGRSPNYEKLKESIETKKNVYLLSAEEINKMDCDVEKILKKLEMI